MEKILSSSQKSEESTESKESAKIQTPDYPDYLANARAEGRIKREWPGPGGTYFEGLLTYEERMEMLRQGRAEDREYKKALVREEYERKMAEFDAEE